MVLNKFRTVAVHWTAFAGLLLTLLVLMASPARADDYVNEWAPPVGSPMPLLDAPDHTGSQRNLASLSGEQGLLLFLNRSADW